MGSHNSSMGALGSIGVLLGISDAFRYVSRRYRKFQRSFRGLHRLSDEFHEAEVFQGDLRRFRRFRKVDVSSWLCL